MNLFADWPFLLLLGLLPFLLLLEYRVLRRRVLRVRFPDTSVLRAIQPTLRVRLRPLLPLLRTGVLTLMVVALARPRAGQTYREVLSEGIDIVLALDVSGSMRAEDFQPSNRLFVAKDTVKRFIEGKRKVGSNDRIGVVVFAANAYTLCPLTLDYGMVLSLIDGTDFAPPEEDGTAIGMAIATAVNRLRHSDAKSKVCILLTDGRNNKGQIDPMTAAEIARAMNVKVYTIGVGTAGEVPYPVRTPFGKQYQMIEIPLDEGSLRGIAETTGGMFFLSSDTESLQRIYEQIGQMEKTRIQYRMWEQFTEKFHPLVVGALLLLALDALLRDTWFMKVP